MEIVTASILDLNPLRKLEKESFGKDAWPFLDLVAVLTDIFYPLLLLMPMPVMNVGHVIVLMFLGGMLMLMRVDSLCIAMSM